MLAARTGSITGITKDCAYLSLRDDRCLINECKHGPTVLTAQLAGQGEGGHSHSTMKAMSSDCRVKKPLLMRPPPTATPRRVTWGPRACRTPAAPLTSPLKQPLPAVFKQKPWARQAAYTPKSQVGAALMMMMIIIIIIIIIITIMFLSQEASGMCDASQLPPDRCCTATLACGAAVK